MKNHDWMNNTGYSMIEVMLVIAILVILSTGSMVAFSHIKYGNTTTCAKEIGAAIDKVRLEAMSKADKPDLYIYQYEKNYYLKASSTIPILDDSGTKIGSNEIKISYLDAVSGEVVVASPAAIRLGFSRSTGSFINTDTAVAGEIDKGPVFYKQLIISGGKTYTITMYETTGKHEIN